VKAIAGIQFYDRLDEILDPAHSALLVVDMQNDFCSSNGHFARHGKSVIGLQSIVQPIARLLEYAREKHIHVLHTQQTTARGLASDSPAWLYFKTRDGKSPDYTLDGSWGHQFVDELRPLPSESVIRKFRPSAFLGTDLDQQLRAAGVETLVVAGCLTQGCVMATVMDASFHDFYGVVVEDCVQSTSQEQHANALRFLRSRYDVLPASDVVRAWSARTPADLGA
jgi:ureidoacrylate peracid hydrolase